MVFFKNFRSTTFFKAFILHAMILAIVTVFSNIIFHHLKNNITPYALSIFTTLLVMILLSFLVHILFFYTFAYGGGMLSPLYHKGQYKLMGR
jgi:hypothetical protein